MLKLNHYQTKFADHDIDRWRIAFRPHPKRIDWIVDAYLFNQNMEIFGEAFVMVVCLKNTFDGFVNFFSGR